MGDDFDEARALHHRRKPTAHGFDLGKFRHVG
jgi:hypothetical protein